MKTHGLILFSALLIAALIMHGQEAAPPSVDLFPEQEEEEASPTPPPNGPELPELKQLDDSFKAEVAGTRGRFAAGARAVAAIEESHRQ